MIPQSAKHCYCPNPGAPPSFGVTETADVFFLADAPPPPTPHTGLANDGLWSWRHASGGSAQCVGEEGHVLGKAPEGARVGAQDLPGRPAQPCSLAVWKPRGREGGGAARQAPSLPETQQTGWGMGMNLGARLCLLPLRSPSGQGRPWTLSYRPDS